jgi:hypothetical protein
MLSTGSWVARLKTIIHRDLVLGALKILNLIRLGSNTPPNNTASFALATVTPNRFGNSKVVLLHLLVNTYEYLSTTVARQPSLKKKKQEVVDYASKRLIRCVLLYLVDLFTRTTPCLH